METFIIDILYFLTIFVSGKAFHSFKPESIAGCIFDALNNMATPQHLKELHIIVFSKQPESYTPIMEELHKKVQSAVGGKPGKCREFISGKGYFYSAP